MNPGRRAEWWRPDLVVQSGYGPGAAAAGQSEASDSSVPFWALMGFTFILLIAPQTFFPTLISLRIALLTAAVAITTHLFDRFIHRQPILILNREMRITLCLVGWAILTLPLSYWQGGSVVFLFDVYFKTLAVFWLLSVVVNTLTRLRQVAWGMSLMGVPLALTGVGNFLSGSFLLGGVDREVQRIVGYDAPLSGNPNDLALMLNLILPLSLALFRSSRRSVVRIVLLPTITLNVIAGIVTFSRAGFLTLGTIFVMYLWKSLRRREWGWATAALTIMLVSIPLLPSGYFDRLSTITDIKSDRTGSAEARWSDMVAATSFVLRNPIVGAGIGMNVLALNQERGASWTALHNVYLQYAVELGIPGLVLFLLLFVGCIKSAGFVRRRADGVVAFRELFCLAEGIEVSLIAFAVAGLFHPVGYHFYFYYIAGLAIAIKAVFEGENVLRSGPQ